MRVILKQDVDNLGTAGEIVDVADGYGNNYLMPRGLAMRATRGAVTDAEAIRAARAKREARTREDAEEQRSRLEGRAVTVRAKAGEDGTLYGSVGSKMIAEAVRGQLGVDLDRRRINLERPIKELGTHEVGVEIYRDISAAVRVDVIPGE